MPLADHNAKPADDGRPKVSIQLGQQKGYAVGTVRLGETDVSDFVSAVTITAVPGRPLQASLRVYVDELQAMDADVRDVVRHLLVDQSAHVENVVAGTLQELYGFLPLSVRCEAARAASEVVQQWVSPTPAAESPVDVAAEAQAAGDIVSGHIVCGAMLVGGPDGKQTCRLEPHAAEVWHEDQIRWRDAPGDVSAHGADAVPDPDDSEAMLRERP